MVYGMHPFPALGAHQASRIYRAILRRRANSADHQRLRACRIPSWATCRHFMAEASVWVTMRL